MMLQNVYSEIHFDDYGCYYFQFLYIVKMLTLTITMTIRMMSDGVVANLRKYCVSKVMNVLRIEDPTCCNCRITIASIANKRI